MSPDFVDIHYHRPPDRDQVYRQRLLVDGTDVKVTFAERVEFDPPIRIDGEIALETGSPVIWFTFPGMWHDIGRFYRADGTFCGYYANILTPPVFEEPGVWRTTDLFLDVWLPPGDTASVLDRDQFDEAVSRGWIDAGYARRATEEVSSILRDSGRGTWPPEVARDWTLARALASSTKAMHPAQSSADSSTR